MPKKKARRKVPVIEVTSTRAEVRSSEKSKGSKWPWEVWIVDYQGFHELIGDHSTLKQAKKMAAKFSVKDCPVIVHIDIPRMEY